ncbi:MAG: LD-carboxypeptidase [Micrococcaceae bacterium]
MKQFKKLAKLQAGDQVGIISPSAGLPGIFPWVQDLGLQRMREVFELKPVEYPTTRKFGSSLQERAKDLMAAFEDENNKAVFASIGGNDQIKLIKYLDPEVFLANPKPFFGFSDNTHFHNFLWNLGIPSYYGGSVMNQFGMNQRMFAQTIESLKQALFKMGEFELPATDKFTDVNLDWANQENLTKPRLLETNEGWHWDGDAPAKGIIWGGCVESVIAQVSANEYLPKTEDMKGVILALETSENIPDHWVIKYLLTGFGERGWFDNDKIQAVLIGRPQGWSLEKQNDAPWKAEYREKQRETVIEAVREYSSDIPIIQNLDFGHTDPQVILPLGNTARIMPNDKKIYLRY